ncbi:uncharacterized protein EI90DRAFT_2627977 [Cantharellus anzutake]|uniref:uncharacterized protein n=1 Tax=Cantharellus anzutake TaxID=1750568 RepID=UPI001904F8B0|nr:uncharacterized protein EI90DRAFT_2627977 [Cantharellus anzutake]KAF8319869.1 hypothetical protein EI90DRAFT_2627977 [Cantharellus anzutake]
MTVGLLLLLGYTVPSLYPPAPTRRTVYRLPVYWRLTLTTTGDHSILPLLSHLLRFTCAWHQNTSLFGGFHRPIRMLSCADNHLAKISQRYLFA